MVKSPLRYPGGKSRAIQQISAFLPESDDLKEYREPFVGGGSFFIYLRQKLPHLKIWINDLNPELCAFWEKAQSDSEELARDVLRLKEKERDGRELFNELLLNPEKFDRAVRFFILNRISFAGMGLSYSASAFVERFTESSIVRVSKLGRVLEGVRITNLDYKHLLLEGGKDVFTFLDPPYLSATKFKLYGKFHAFDHKEFANTVKQCEHSWLITYDDSPEIRENFDSDSVNIQPWLLQYGMSRKKGKELFITPKSPER